MKPALIISARDTVATALETLEAGRRVTLGEIELTVSERIPHGHKVALVAIAAGQPVLKYGSPIGLASSRGRGDLDVLASPQEPRLAEPCDPGPEAGDAAESAPAAETPGATLAGPGQAS